MYFKILSGYVDVCEEDFFDRNVGLRGHCKKLYVKPFLTLLAEHIPRRAVACFNQLSESTASVKTISKFRAQLFSPPEYNNIREYCSKFKF